MKELKPPAFYEHEDLQPVASLKKFLMVSNRVTDEALRTAKDLSEVRYLQGRSALINELLSNFSKKHVKDDKHGERDTSKYEC